MNQIILGINALVYVPVKYYNGIYRFESLKGAANQSGSNMVFYPILSIRNHEELTRIVIGKDNVRKKLFQNYAGNKEENAKIEIK